MRNICDLSGQKFGRLLVVSFSGRRERCTLWLCKCDCGNTTIVSTSALKSGNTKSCGCLHREYMIERNQKMAKHGAKTIDHERDRLYDIWISMRKRCNLPSSDAYKYYGGRGIKVCEEWDKDYIPFRDWALSNGYQKNLSIDRIDTNGNYCPENCRWVTAKTQANNRTNNRVIEYNGEARTIAEWSRITGLSYRIIQYRLDAGWEVQRIFEQSRKRRK